MLVLNLGISEIVLGPGSEEVCAEKVYDGTSYRMVFKDDTISLLHFGETPDDLMSSVEVRYDEMAYLILRGMASPSSSPVLVPPAPDWLTTGMLRDAVADGKVAESQIINDAGLASQLEYLRQSLGQNGFESLLADLGWEHRERLKEEM